ncbi:hypothetical protein Clacol_001903 [Clathrus columnatus]|uniref:2-dehydropantoate 2-reductase n=1 Tax=Clathrus columnatus TaxID=1419009 RepID=A0AAV5A2H3_9AGAM|nr:hypothetical protein Clacol_001903 [Clathrus columnatus]
MNKTIEPATTTTTTQVPIRILIVGAGAVGCFYGSRMHHPPDALVSLVCRSNYSAIKRSGVQLQTRNFGDYTFNPEFVFSSIQEASEARIPLTEVTHTNNNNNTNETSPGPISSSSSSPTLFHDSSSSPAPTFTSSLQNSPDVSAVITWDYVVVTTKALPDVSDDSSLITRVIHPFKTAIVLIQNGVGVEDPYQTRFPDNSVLSAVTVVSAEQVQPGVIVQNRWTRISIGPYGALQDGEARTKEIVKLLKRGGVKDAEVYTEKALQQVRWHKIAINGSMNPSAVLSSTENARMVKSPELRRHLKGCMEEVFHAAHVVLGEPLPSYLPTAEQILTSSERNTGGRPSMLVDWEKGHPMELEVILGNPIRIARSKGVEMPRLQAMYSLLVTAQARRDEKREKKLIRQDNITLQRSRL